MNEAFDSVISKLFERGLSSREISGAFKRRFSIKVSFENGRPNLDKENAKKFIKNELEIGRHFDAFLKTKGKHAGYCRREKDRYKKTQVVPKHLIKDTRISVRLLKLNSMLLVGLLGLVFWSLFWLLKNHLGKVCTLLFIVSGILILYYIGEREAAWETRGHYNRLVNNWLWVMLASGAVLFIRFIVNWLIDPVFCPSAAKGLYMGQSLNNQREIKESLSDIRDTLDS